MTFVLMIWRPPRSRRTDTLSPYTTLFRAGSADAVRALLSDANAFRGNKMNQLKAAADTLQGQIDDMVTDKRSEVAAAIDGRRAEILGSTYYVQIGRAHVCTTVTNAHLVYCLQLDTITNPYT